MVGKKQVILSEVALKSQTPSNTYLRFFVLILSGFSLRL